MALETGWEKTTIAESFQKLGSGHEGITEAEASHRLSKHGRNEIQQRRKISPLKIFLSQFTSPLILLLIARPLCRWHVIPPGSDSQGIDTILILIIVFAAGFSDSSRTTRPRWR